MRRSPRLKHAILQDQTIAPGQIAVGQIVSEKLKFKKDEDRTLHLVVQIAGDDPPLHHRRAERLRRAPEV